MGPPYQAQGSSYQQNVWVVEDVGQKGIGKGRRGKGGWNAQNQWGKGQTPSVPANPSPPQRVVAPLAPPSPKPPVTQNSQEPPPTTPSSTSNGGGSKNEPGKGEEKGVGSGKGGWQNVKGEKGKGAPERGCACYYQEDKLLLQFERLLIFQEPFAEIWLLQK